MRIDIMPNLFSKISSQNGTLKLFAGGRQIKLSSIIDVARCFEFMEKKDIFDNQILILTKDKLQSKKLQKFVKNIIQK